MDVLETPTARADDPITSFEAADGISDEVITEVQTAILRALLKPLTHDELVLAVIGQGVQRSPQRIRSSCAELVRAGLVTTSGEYGRSVSGRRAHKWVRVDT